MYSVCAIAGEEELCFKDMSHQGQQQDEIKEKETIIPDEDHSVREFNIDVSVNRAEAVEEPEVKPERKALLVYTEGQIVYSVHIGTQRNSLQLQSYKWPQVLFWHTNMKDNMDHNEKSKQASCISWMGYLLLHTAYISLFKH